MRRIFILTILTLFARLAQGEQQACARIVSLAPSVTEVLFELGLGDRIVGVTRYCRYPPEAQSLPKIGGFYDISLENLIALKPTYVFGLRENAEIRDNAARFGVLSLEVDHSTVDGIKSSITAIARVCGVDERAKAKLSSLEQRERALQEATVGAPKYRTLVVVGRTHEGNALSGVYVSGKDGFYSGVLHLLGMENVNAQGTVAMPLLSPEGLLALNPEVIIEVVNVDDTRARSATDEVWRRYNNVPAVKHNRIIMLTQDFASIPGPRYILVAEEIAGYIARWKEVK